MNRAAFAMRCVVLAGLWCVHARAQNARDVTGERIPIEPVPNALETKPPAPSLEGELRLGASIRRFYGLQSTSASLMGRIGVYVPVIYLAASAGIYGEKGATRGGLDTSVYGLDVNLSLAFDRVRFGFTPGLSRYAVVRATDASSVTKYLSSIGADLSVTLVKIASVAITANAHGELSPKALGATASLGVRF
jgi:hypothetical protein